MLCPRCNEELDIIQNEQLPVDETKYDIMFKCDNEHRYFIRIDGEDLMEDG